MDEDERIYSRWTILLGNSSKQASCAERSAMAQTFSRRLFIIRTSIAAGAASAVSSVPVLGALIDGGEASGPLTQGAAEADAGLADAGAGTAEPLIAHVRDPMTGEIGIFNGTREVVIHDTQLAGSLLKASK